MTAERASDTHGESISQSIAYIKQFLLEVREKCPEISKHADVIAFIQSEVNPALVKARQLERELAEQTEAADASAKLVDDLQRQLSAAPSIVAPTSEACKIARDHIEWPELALSKRQTGILAAEVLRVNMDHEVAALSAIERRHPAIDLLAKLLPFYMPITPPKSRAMVEGWLAEYNATLDGTAKDNRTG